MNAETAVNPLRLAQQAPRCTARSKRTGLPCRAPAVRGHCVCRMHGAGGEPLAGRAMADFGRASTRRRSSRRPVSSQRSPGKRAAYVERDDRSVLGPRTSGTSSGHGGRLRIQSVDLAPGWRRAGAIRIGMVLSPFRHDPPRSSRSPPLLAPVIFGIMAEHPERALSPANQPKTGNGGKTMRP
jgi:hypothetical protein